MGAVSEAAKKCQRCNMIGNGFRCDDPDCPNYSPLDDPRVWVEMRVECARDALRALEALARGYSNLFPDVASDLASLGMGFGNLAHFAVSQSKGKR